MHCSTSTKGGPQNQDIPGESRQEIAGSGSHGEGEVKQEEQNETEYTDVLHTAQEAKLRSELRESSIQDGSLRSRQLTQNAASILLPDPHTARAKELQGKLQEGLLRELAGDVSPPVHCSDSASDTEILYTGAPLPRNEEERQDALCCLNVLDTKNKPDDRFDDITRLLCQIFRVPVAIVSLVDANRQWFKSVQGLPVPSTDRRSSFCAWTLLPQHPEILVVPDALEDVRFAENSLVQNEPFIRFYAGAPLVTSRGHRLGSLCIIDRTPRELEAQSCNILINFAEVVVRELEKEQMRALEAAQMKSQATKVLRAFDAFKEGIMVCDSSTPHLQILFFNDAFSRLTGGMEREKALDCSVWDIFQLNESKETVMQKSEKAIKAGQPFSVLVLRQTSSGESIQLVASFRPGASEGLDKYTLPVAIPGSMASEAEDGVSDNLYFCTVVKIKPRASFEALRPSVDKAHFRAEASLAPKHPFSGLQLGPLLGQGSFGQVFRGMWHGAQVAVKIIMPPQRQGPSSAEDGGWSPFKVMDRAALECLLTADLSHPNIVSLYKFAHVPVKVADGGDGGEVQDLMETWMILEYCDRGTLQYAIDRGKFDEGFITNGRRNKKPFLPAIRKTVMEIAGALCYLHGCNIVHGDLTGENVLLMGSMHDKRGFRVKVADFGLARTLETDSLRTQTHGTVTHMPPELLVQGHLSKAADSFAWGAILWELCSQERCWAGLLPMQVMYHVTVLKESLTFPDTVPKPYRDLGNACLQYDASRRPTFPEIMRCLEEIPS